MEPIQLCLCDCYFYTIMNINLWQTSTNLLVLRKTKCQFDKKKKMEVNNFNSSENECANLVGFY